MPLNRKLFIAGILTLGSFFTLSCSTSNTSSGSGGSTFAGGSWVGSMTSAETGFNTRTLRLNLYQNHGSGSCFTIGGSGAITVSSGGDSHSGCWVGGTISPSEGATCASGSSTGSSQLVNGYQSGVLQGNQIEFDLKLASEITMTFSGTVNGNNIKGFFSSPAKSITTNETDEDGKAASRLCPSVTGSFDINK